MGSETFLEISEAKEMDIDYYGMYTKHSFYTVGKKVRRNIILFKH